MGPDFLGGGPLPGQLEIEEFADRCRFDFSHSLWQAGRLPSESYSSMQKLHASVLPHSARAKMGRAVSSDMELPKK
jgi:hypothetical protein